MLGVARRNPQIPGFLAQPPLNSRLLLGDYAGRLTCERNSRAREDEFVDSE